MFTSIYPIDPSTLPGSNIFHPIRHRSTIPCTLSGVSVRKVNLAVFKTTTTSQTGSLLTSFSDWEAENAHNLQPHTYTHFCQHTPRKKACKPTTSSPKGRLMLYSSVDDKFSYFSGNVLLYCIRFDAVHNRSQINTGARVKLHTPTHSLATSHSPREIFQSRELIILLTNVQSS